MLSDELIAGGLAGVIDTIRVEGRLAEVTTRLRTADAVRTARLAPRACAAIKARPGVVRQVQVVDRDGRLLDTCRP